jgi:hypothetical protein
VGDEADGGFGVPQRDLDGGVAVAGPAGPLVGEDPGGAGLAEQVDGEVGAGWEPGHLDQSHPFGHRRRHGVGQRHQRVGVERAVGQQRRVVEAVPGGVVADGGDVVLPGCVSRGGPALDLGPEGEGLASGLDVGRGRVTERRALVGPGNRGHHQIGEGEAGALASEHADRGVADGAFGGVGVADGGGGLGQGLAPAQHGDVDDDGAGGHGGGEDGGDRAQALAVTVAVAGGHCAAELAGHGPGGEGGHHPALRDDGAVPRRAHLDVVAPGHCRVGRQFHLASKRDRVARSPFVDLVYRLCTRHVGGLLQLPARNERVFGPGNFGWPGGVGRVCDGS